MRNTPVILTRRPVAVGAIAGAYLRVDNLEPRAAVLELILREGARRLILHPHGAVVQQAGVDGIDVAFKRLEPVAGQLIDDDPLCAVRQHVGFDIWKRRRRVARTHVGPDDAAALSGRVGDGLHFRFEIGLGWFVWHVDAVAVDIELPAVVHAAKAGFLVSSEEERSAAMWTVVLNEADPPSVSRKAMSCSPSRSTRTGSLSGAGSSDDSTAGIQYSRMSAPIGVPGPTRVMSSFSSRLSMLTDFRTHPLSACYPCAPSGRQFFQGTFEGEWLPTFTAVERQAVRSGAERSKSEAGIGAVCIGAAKERRNC